MARRWPAEWEPHRAIWLAWPHQREDWPDRFGPIPWVYADFMKKLTRHERVRLIVQDSTRQEAVDILQRAGVDLGRVEMISHATDRVWTRDYCPIWVEDGGRIEAVKWQFNAWAKYENWEKDEAAGLAVAGRDSLLPEHGGRRVVLEGGAIDGNGAGTMLTTFECLLSEVQARNPGLTRQDYERVFAEYIGVSKTIWLQRGIAGDDTHGHVDDLARFVAEEAVVCVYEPDPGDENHLPTRENLEILRASTTQSGRPLRVIPLPMPRPIVFSGQRLPASYANFLIANGAVFVPTFNDPMDRRALGILADCFPRREVIGIYSGDLIWGLGTLHCMSMQEPEKGQ